MVTSEDGWLGIEEVITLEEVFDSFVYFCQREVSIVIHVLLSILMITN